MKFLITGGSTDEKIDEVMTITNMSTGKLAISLTELLLQKNHEVVLIINRKSNIDKIKLYESSTKLNIIKISDTIQMQRALEDISEFHTFDYIIHSAAVADYNCEYTFRMEDMAEEIFNKISLHTTQKDILDILTNPNCKLNSNTKISSYQPNLTVKLGLTPKLISKLRNLFPNSIIAGFKLLNGVAKRELFLVAGELLIKNNIDVVFANDLLDLRVGDNKRYAISMPDNTNKMDVFPLCNAEDMIEYLLSIKKESISE